MDNEFDLLSAGHTAGHDLPLTFRWRSASRALRHLGLPEAKDSRYEDVRNATLTEARLAAEVGQWVSFSRRKEYYARRSRYFGDAVSLRTVAAAVNQGTLAGLFEEDRAHPGRRGRQSRLRATSLLCEALEVCPQSKPPSEVIWLRDHTGLVDYEDTPLTRRMRREIETINRAMSSILINLNGSGVRKTDHHWIVDDNQVIPGPPHLRRVFSRGSFKKGGRAYGWYQVLPSRYRAIMTINGEAVLEPDFAQLHAQIIYALRGIPLDGDAYETGEFSRDQGKMAFNVAVNARSPRAAIGALMQNLKLEKRAARKLLQSIIQKHKAIVDVFCSDLGVCLMKIDSDIIIDAMLRCVASGIAALPIHDSIAVRARDADQTAEIMMAAFATRLPKSSPCKVRIKKQPVPQMEVDEQKKQRAA